MRRRPRSIRIQQLAALMVAGSLAPAIAEVAHEMPPWSFDQHEIALGSAKHLTVLTGFFLGGALSDLAVLNVDEGDDCRLRIFAMDNGGDGADLGHGTWTQRLGANLGPEVSFVDVANIAGRDRLITFERGRLNWFDPESATQRALVEVPTNYKATHDLEGSPNQPGSEIPPVDITRDLNHDGRDDLVMPDVDGFWISTQLSDGSFADAVRVGPREPFADESTGKLDASEGSDKYRDTGITAATIPVYLSRVHEMDYDLDGLSDLVFWNEDHFEVYLQDETGLFDPIAKTFTVNVPFDSDGTYSRMFDFTDKGMFSLLFGLNKKTKRTVLHSFHDLNGDRIADLVTLTLAGRSILRQRSVYEAHFGSAGPDGVVFARHADTAIHPRSKAGGMQPWGYASQRFEDLDGDGQLEIMFRGVKVGGGGMIRALVGNSVPIDLEFSRMEDGIYPDKPTSKRKIRRFAPFAGLGNVFFPPVLMGDVNGDGRADLLLGQNPDELHIFFGAPGPELLVRKPQKVAVSVPPDERNTWLVDLNKDGKQDLLLHQTPTGHEPDKPHRVTMLVAR